MDDAEIACDHALEFNPDYAEARSNKGVIEMSQGKMDAAKEDFRKAIHQNQNLAQAYNSLGVVELWQQRFRDKLLQTRIIERQLTYNPATKEYKVVSLNGEDREAFMTKQLRDAQRVLSELRAGKLAPDAALDPRELYFVRVRADVSLNGVNSWIARFSGEAAETGWVQSPLLTPTRRQ